MGERHAATTLLDEPLRFLFAGRDIAAGAGGVTLTDCWLAAHHVHVAAQHALPPFSALHPGVPPFS